MSSPSYLHNPLSPDDTNLNNSSSKPPIHTLWQPTKDYPPTPPPMKFNDIPLPSVNSIFNQPEYPVTILSSCRFPSKHF